VTSKSQFVCNTCGLAIYLWRGERWKHAAGGRSTPSCGKVPVVAKREDYERNLAAALNHALRRNPT
jgi:hypothetical protein